MQTIKRPVSENIAIKRIPFFKLPMTFDPVRIKKELDIARAFAVWPPEEPFGIQNFPGSNPEIFHDGQWVGMGLQTQGADWRKTDPGGPGLEPFMPTELLGNLPYFKEIIDSFKCGKRSVRFSSLPPGAEIAEHCDTYHDFKFGQIRLHMAVVTNPDVEVYIDGHRCILQPGEMWYGDFSRPHYVKNGGSEERVHLLMDLTINDWVLSLFPDDFVADVLAQGYVAHEQAILPDLDILKKYECDFMISAVMMKGIFETDDGIAGQYNGKLRVHNAALVLSVDDQPLITLNPISKNRFYLIGWCGERFFEMECDEADELCGLHLVIRHGHHRTRISLPLI